MIRYLRQPAVVNNLGTRSNVTHTVLGTPLSVTANIESYSVTTGAVTVLGGVGVTGTINAGNIAAGTIYGTIMTPNQPQITQIGLQQSLSTVDLTITGNLVLPGTTTIVNSTNTSVSDSLFNLHVGTGGATLTVDDGNDLGLVIYYYKSGLQRRDFLGWDNSSQQLVYLSNVAVGSGQVTGTPGTFSLGNIFLNGAVDSTNTSTGSFVVSGGIGISGNIHAGRIYANSIFYANGQPYVNTGLPGSPGITGATGAPG
ncbi:hypothetical protein EBX93_18050, partial [bacterium]|nr:hypothetical protein [bacterium]